MKKKVLFAMKALAILHELQTAKYMYMLLYSVAYYSYTNRYFSLH